MGGHSVPLFGIANPSYSHSDKSILKSEGVRSGMEDRFVLVWVYPQETKDPGMVTT